MLKAVEHQNLTGGADAHWILVQLRKDPDVVARVLEEFDPSGTQDGAKKVELGGFVLV